MTLSAAAPVARPTTRAARLRRLSMPFGVLLLAALAACNGTAVVTLTATPSTDTYLAYRVGLNSIQLETSSGRTAGAALPKGTTVDLARLTNLSEVVGAASLPQGNYSRALITLDYSSAQIIYDNGTVDGLALTPVDASGQALGQVTLLLYLDPSEQLGVVRGSSARLSLGFNLAASNVINAAQKTVTVTPTIAASTQPLDSKVVRIRGPLGSINSSSTGFTSGIVPFDFGNAGAGSLGVSAQSVTTFEINGIPSTGSAGMTAMAALKAGVMVESFGTLTTSSSSSSSLLDTTDTAASATEVTTCSDGTTPVTGTNGVLSCADGSTLTTTSEGASNTGSLTATTVNFSASQVLAGSSVQGDGVDRVSGIVTGRSGDTLTIDEGTLLTNEGANTLVDGTATIKIGPNTQVTQFGGASTESNGTNDISVGSLIYAFGTARSISSSSVTLDASAGRARLGQTTASGLVTGQPSTDTLTLNLTTLGGRSAASFDFAGTGTAGADASKTAYLVTTANLTLTNATTDSPVQVTGSVTPFGAAGPSAGDLSGTALLDYTTIDAELVMDYGAGTPAPFVSYSTTEIVLDARNSAVGVRHEIQTGAQTVNIVGIPTDPQIVPNASANSIFTIGHAVSGTYENFDTYSAFVTQLQLELNGNVLVTGVTASGQYTPASYSFSASSITLLVNN